MPRTAVNTGMEIEYDTFGSPSDPALLLVMGFTAQMTLWEEDFCRMLADGGRYVIRFDNRDCGLSTHLDGVAADMAAPPYLLSDMAEDAFGLLTALGIERAHIAGASMGGMIVQTMAIEHPDRLITMTSVMSATGEPEYRKSSPRAFELLTAPPPTDCEGYVQNWIDGLREWGSPEFFDEERARATAEAAWNRAAPTDGGTGRQYMAIGASGSWADGLRQVTTPTLVMHGDKDTLIDQIGGRRTAELIPGARFELIEGMGHDYPPQLWRRWVDLVVGHIREHTL